MSVMDGYLAAAEAAVALLENPEVAAGWEGLSALPEMTVGDLAGHLAHQIFSVDPALQRPASAQAPIPLVEHFTRASWIGAPLDSEVSSGIRAKAAGIGAEGATALAGRARAALASQRAAFAERSPDHVVFIPETGWSLRLGDFLVTRMLELAVHRDDLAVSVQATVPDLPPSAFDPVLVLLARLAALRHGQAALLRALARVERAPAAVNAI